MHSGKAQEQRQLRQTVLKGKGKGVPAAGALPLQESVRASSAQTCCHRVFNGIAQQILQLYYLCRGRGNRVGEAQYGVPKVAGYLTHRWTDAPCECAFDALLAALVAIL